MSAPDFPDFGIGRTASTLAFGSAEASTDSLGLLFLDFADFADSAGTNLGLVGRDEAATLAAEAGGGVAADADDMAEARTGDVLETVTGSFESSKTGELRDLASEPDASPVPLPSLVST
jgi:hypothetical protein